MEAVLTDAGLLDRQALSDEDFLPHFYELMANFPPREWSDEQFERGLRYPWYRPRHSYLLRDGEVGRIDALPPLGGRLPLLAIGGNAAPRYLAAKLAHHEAPEDREVLVLAGELHELDVVAAAAVSIYGAMAATLAASPGTAVRAGVLMVTPTQLTTLAWGEMPYRLGRLHGVEFTVEDGVEGVAIDDPLAFVSRWGAFSPDGEPAALAAIPARGRRFRAWTQRELMDRAAEVVLGPGHRAEDAVRVLCQQGGAYVRIALPKLLPHGCRFDFPGWSPVA